MDALENALAVLSTREYGEALRKCSEWKERIQGASAFRLEPVAAEAAAYFSLLKKSSPAVFGALKIQRKEISELIILKRTGLRLVLD